MRHEPMMDLRLGISTVFAPTRFPEPEEWARIAGEFLGLRYVQLTASLASPFWPESIIHKQIAQIKHAAAEYNVNILHTFTDPYVQLNHLAHPDEAVRKFWVSWFKKFAEISAELGAESMGSHFGIFSVRDIGDEKRREFVFRENVSGWAEISDHAKSAGLKYLTWEPMSVPREQGETIEETKRIQEEVNKVTAIPMKICLDVDHGLPTQNPDDTDPYAWIRAFGAEAPVMHVKQSYAPIKGGPHPFLPEHNEKGRIHAGKVIAALKESGAQDCMLTLELNAPGREPGESQLLDWLKTSVEYWRQYVKD